MEKYKFTSKNFGEIIISDDILLHHYTSIKYNDQEVDIVFNPFIKYFNRKVKRFFEIIDKYAEIVEITKKAIISNYTKNANIKKYFIHHFDLMSKEQIIEIFGINTFEQFDIKDAVEKLKLPRFYFHSAWSKEVFLLVQYCNFLPEKNDNVGLWVEVDFDDEIIVTDFLEPY